MPEEGLLTPETRHSKHFLAISSISCCKVWLDFQKDIRRNLAYFHFFDVFCWAFSRSSAISKVGGVKVRYGSLFFSVLSLLSPFRFFFRWILGFLGIFHRKNSCRAMRQMPEKGLFHLKGSILYFYWPFVAIFVARSDWIFKNISAEIWPIFTILSCFGFFLISNYVQSRRYKNISDASLFSRSSLFLLPFASLFGEFQACWAFSIAGVLAWQSDRCPRKACSHLQVGLLGISLPFVAFSVAGILAGKSDRCPRKVCFYLKVGILGISWQFLAVLVLSYGWILKRC